MANITIPVQTSSVPSGFCFNGFDSPSWLEIVKLLFVQVPSNTGVIISATRPTPEQSDTNAWYRLDDNGYPDKLYVRAGGQWLSPHPIPEGMIWISTATSLSAIKSLDRPVGEAVDATISSTTGPFWEPITDVNGIPTNPTWAGRFILNPGVITKTDGSTITIGYGNTGGEYDHKLTTEESVPHTHSGAPKYDVSITDGIEDGPHYTTGQSGSWGGSGGVALAHNTMPPYLGLYLIRRTSRLFYVAP